MGRMMKSFIGLAAIAAMMGNTLHDIQSDKKVRAKACRFRLMSKTPLTPKQAKARAKAKRAKESRRMNR